MKLSQTFDGENLGAYCFDRLNEEECSFCGFPTMHYVECCWSCGRHILLFCPKCGHVICLESGDTWNDEGMR